MPTYRIAVFASGNGSNFQAIANQVKSKQLEVSIACLICDRPTAYVIRRAQEADVPVWIIQPKNYASKPEFEQAILQVLREAQVDLIVLAGYMRLIGHILLEAFPSRIINIHPSILPAFPGVNAIEQAFTYGVKQTGVTVHLVDEGIDTGPILAQRTLEISREDTLETVAKRITEIEHQLLPQVIGWFASGKVHLKGHHVEIRN